jgi:hypothetical protein
MDKIIYVLTNEAMPGYVKIGRTSNNLEQRIKELSASTSIPLPFICFYACTVKDAQFVEHQLHDTFDDNRVNPKREFFQIAPERVVAALKLATIEEVTPKKDLIENPKDRQALANVRKIREKFNFGMAKIPIGAELVFSRDESARAKVIDNHYVEYNGKKISLSESAKQILGYSYLVQGTAYWMYEGETLDERRKRLMSEV